MGDNNTITVTHNGDVWRATLGDHAANAVQPWTAIILVLNKAQEAGHIFDGEPGEQTPIPAPDPIAEPGEDFGTITEGP